MQVSNTSFHKLNSVNAGAQLYEMNETLKHLQILICSHENARFLSLVLLRSRFTIVKVERT